MKVSLKWLGEYVDITLSALELGNKLTIAGLELSAVESVGQAWDNVVVGEVTDLTPHPHADRLTLATVDLGGGGFTVVCGAPNIRVGQRVPFARVGARLIDGRTGQTVSLKPARIRGVVSEGMVCSEKELGISDDHESILVLPLDAPVGAPLGDYLGDTILDFDITPNRPDCLSVIGIAREVAALTGAPLRPPSVGYQESEQRIDSLVSVSVSAPDLCPRYCATLILGVKVGSSPGWLQQRLNSYGMRPVNSVVDVTNYVMLEYGQPLHAFDYHRLKGRQVVVRRAAPAETITTLDGTERRLDPDMLVIADEEEAIAVAGIMGSGASEVTEATEAVLLESANFNQVAIRRGCERLQLRSEASVRFEKGLSSELPPEPLRRATQLLLEVAGGAAAGGVVDVYPGKREYEPVVLPVREVARLSGLEVDVDEMLKMLRSLGFECREVDRGSRIAVSVPYWRSDIRCAPDLVEEIVRIIGYERIPVTRLSSALPRQQLRSSPASLRSSLRRGLRDALVGLGFQEILTYPLVSLERLQKLSPRMELETPPLKVANPMTREQEYLRTGLRAGVLATLAHNQKFESAGIRVFEIGKVFNPRQPATDEVKRPHNDERLPREDEMLCAALGGPRSGLSWHAGQEMLDFFDAKGVVENVLNGWGINVGFRVSDDETLFPGRGAEILVDDDRIGIVGEIHPKVAQAFDLSDTVFIMELDLERLLPRMSRTRRYRPIPRFPGVSRDIALVVDEQVSYHTMESIIRAFPLVTKVTLFDLYRGEQVPAGKKSFAIRIIYQSLSHTLTDDEVDNVEQQMLDILHQETGATLRR